jgi:hypothetical protein
MATYTKYENFVQVLANKEVDAFGATDTWKAVIHTDAPVVATDTTLTDLTQISGTNGYTTGGTSIAFTSTRSGGTVTATSTDVVWTASGGNLGGSTTGRYVSYYDDTPTTPTADPLAASWDYGSTFTIADTETLTLDFGATLWTLA